MSALNLVGNTPLIELDFFSENNCRLFAKVEYMQPGGSIKDRAAKNIIITAKQSGKLKEGQVVVEMTSGNMGAGLAVVCNALGHNFVAFISAGNSRERIKMMEALGTKVYVVEQVDGIPGNVTGRDIEAAQRRAKQYAESESHFYVDQFNSESGIRAHENTTGPEIWQQTNGQITDFVSVVGSGATFVGTSRYLRSIKEDLNLHVVEPAGFEFLGGGNVSHPTHIIQGTGYGVVPLQWNSVTDKNFFAVSEADVLQARKWLAEREGLYVGYSAAANVAGCVKLIKGSSGDKKQIVTILCDTGLKY